MRFSQVDQQGLPEGLLDLNAKGKKFRTMTPTATLGRATPFA